MNYLSLNYTLVTEGMDDFYEGVSYSPSPYVYPLTTKYLKLI